MIKFETIAELASALRAAATAHHEFESKLGHTDVNWQEWYASKIALDQLAKANFKPEIGEHTPCKPVSETKINGWFPNLPVQRHMRSGGNYKVCFESQCVTKTNESTVTVGQQTGFPHEQWVAADLGPSSGYGWEV